MGDGARAWLKDVRRDVEQTMDRRNTGRLGWACVARHRAGEKAPGTSHLRATGRDCVVPTPSLNMFAPGELRHRGVRVSVGRAARAIAHRSTASGSAQR